MTLRLITELAGLLDDVAASDGFSAVVAVRECRALLGGHFRLQSAPHSGHFLRYAKIGWSQEHSVAAGRALASRLDAAVAAGSSPLVVLSPESSGYYLGDAVQQAWSSTLAIAAIDAQRCPIDRLRSGEIPPGSRVVVINDVVLSTATLERLCRFAESQGAEVVGAGVFTSLDPDAFNAWSVRRGIAGAHLSVGRWPIHRDPAECPHCQRREELLPATEFN